MTIKIVRPMARNWWIYLKQVLYPNTLEMFEALAALCQEGCEHCHLILCKKLKGD